MKFFVAFTVLIAVAVANPLFKFNKPAASEIAELEAIIAAINSPSTDPATASLLEEQLAAIIGELNPISVGPAIVETNPISVGPAIIDFHPISVGPAIIDFPLPDGGAVTDLELSPISVGPEIIDFPVPVGAVEPTPVIQPSPVIVGDIPAGATPLVQIIVNVNQQQSAVESAPAVVPTPAETPVVDEVYVPGPVNVVDNVVVEPEQVVAPIVVEPIVPGPVNVVDSAIVEPVQVVTPVVVEPVIVGTPIIPAPAVVLPDTLN